VLGHQCRQITILTKGQQVFFVQRVDDSIGIFIDDLTRNDEGTAFVGGSQPIHAETTKSARLAYDTRRDTNHPGKQVTDPNKLSKDLAR
jgi:hypothetical protein